MVAIRFSRLVRTLLLLPHNVAAADKAVVDQQCCSTGMLQTQF
jgi:hypothetical protein